MHQIEEHEVNQLAQYYIINFKKRAERYHPEFWNWVKAQQFYNPGFSQTRLMWHILNGAAIPSCKTCGTDVNWDIVTQTYRAYCSRKCTQHPASKKLTYCPVCNNEFIKKTDRRVCCSIECREKYDHRVLSEGEFTDMLNIVSAPGVNVMSIARIHLAFVRQLYAVTDGKVPPSWQIRRRVKFLVDGYKSKVERAADSQLHREQELRNTADLVGIPNCKQCGSSERVYNRRTRRLSVFCGNECKSIFSEKIAMAKRLADEKRVLPRDEYRKIYGRTPANKNMSPELNDPEWLMYQHYTLQRTKRELADQFGVDKATISNRFKQFGIDSLTFDRRKTEDQLVSFVESIVGSVVRNERTICKPKQLDIVCVEQKIAIEFCGLYWHSTNQQRITSEYHFNKFNQCKDAGYTLITVFEDEWRFNQSAVRQRIASLLRNEWYCDEVQHGASLMNSTTFLFKHPDVCVKTFQLTSSDGKRVGTCWTSVINGIESIVDVQGVHPMWAMSSLQLPIVFDNRWGLPSLLSEPSIQLPIESVGWGGDKRLLTKRNDLGRIWDCGYSTV